MSALMESVEILWNWSLIGLFHLGDNTLQLVYNPVNCQFRR